MNLSDRAIDTPLPAHIAPIEDELGFCGRCRYVSNFCHDRNMRNALRSVKQVCGIQAICLPLASSAGSIICQSRGSQPKGEKARAEPPECFRQKRIQPLHPQTHKTGLQAPRLTDTKVDTLQSASGKSGRRFYVRNRVKTKGRSASSDPNQTGCAPDLSKTWNSALIGLTDGRAGDRRQKRVFRLLPPKFRAALGRAYQRLTRSSQADRCRNVKPLQEPS